MAISPYLSNYLAHMEIHFQLRQHRFSHSCFDAACSAHIPAASMVKAVVLRERRLPRYLVAVLPASHRLRLDWCNQTLRREYILASEQAIADIFPDCATGAIPAIPQAYGMKLIWDEALKTPSLLYFEAGDHQALIELDQSQFAVLFRHQPQGMISLPSEKLCGYHSHEIRGSMRPTV